MENWIVDLLVGVFSAILGFIGGFFTKTIVYKKKQSNKLSINQKAKGKDINQNINLWLR